MNALILEDDFISRIVLHKLLSPYGECHVAVRGVEAVEAFEMALAAGQPYDLVCLDILVPDLDGHKVLQAIRAIEAKQGIYSGQGAKIIMTTALDDMKSVMQAYSELCDGYLPKPISQRGLTQVLCELKLIQAGPAEVVSD
jgi:two-component system chemotaxis response regulator CheY